MTEPLSPAAAVMIAYWKGQEASQQLGVAAALRAAADQFFTDWDGMCCAEHLKAIAAEMEAAK